MKFKGIIGYNDKGDQKGVKQEVSTLNITSDQIMLNKINKNGIQHYHKAQIQLYILIERDEYIEKIDQKGISSFNLDDMAQNEFQLNLQKSNLGRSTLDEENSILKKLSQNQQQQYLEFWQQQSKKGKYLDQLSITGTQNQSLPQIAPQKSPSNLGRVLGNINNQKVRNFSAASKDPIKTPQIKQYQVSSSQSNKKNSFYQKDYQKEQICQITQENTTNTSQTQLENEGPLKSKLNLPLDKNILRSYTTERVNSQKENKEDLTNNQYDDVQRRSSQYINKMLNRSATRTPNKNQQTPPSLQQLFSNNNNSSFSDANNYSNENNKIISQKTKLNQNNIQQMRNLQNSQGKQNNNEMYNFYYNQDQQSPITSKRNSQKNNLQLNKDKIEYTQQQIQEKFKINKPQQNQQQALNQNFKLNRNTPLRSKRFDNVNDMLNKSDNCLLTPLKLSPSPKDLKDQFIFNMGISQDQIKLQNKEKPILQTKLVAAPPTFKKDKLKIRSKENLDQLDYSSEGRNIKTEGSALDHINLVSSTLNKQNIKAQPNPPLYSSSTTKKQKSPQNLKESFFVKYNKISIQNQKNQEEQNQIIRTLRNIKQKNLLSLNSDQNNTNESIDNLNIDLISNNLKVIKDQFQQYDNVFKKISFHEIDPTIQREETISQDYPNYEQIQIQKQDKIFQDSDKSIQNTNFSDQNFQQVNIGEQKYENKSEVDVKLQNSMNDNKPQSIDESQVLQEKQNILATNQSEQTTIQNSLSITPNRSRANTFQTEKTQTKLETIQENPKQQQNLNNSQQDINGKKPLLKVKLNLEILLFIEEKLYLIFEQVQFHDNISYVHTCKDYLELITSCEQERLEEWISKMEELIKTKKPQIPLQNSIIFLQNSFEKGVTLISPILDIYHDLKKIVNDIFRDVDKSSTQTLITNLLEFFAKKINSFERNRQLAMQEELEGPYLPPAKNENIYTLVLDLDETLIHFVDALSELQSKNILNQYQIQFKTPAGGNFLMRPFLESFLKEMSKIYEIVVFTVGMQNYANWVIDTFDRNKYITHRLYRQHAFSKQYNYIKDLSKIGRDLSRTLIIDNVADNFKLQPNNGIHIKSWFSDMTDHALKELIPLLKEIIKQKPSDIRVTLKQQKNKYTPLRVKHYFTLPQ